MTNWETLILVLVPLLGLVLPLLVSAGQMAKLNHENYILVKETRSYKRTFVAYFATFDIPIALTLFILAYVCFKATIGAASIPDTGEHIIGFILILTIGIGAFLYAGGLCYIKLQYWQHTKNRILTFSPDTKTVEVQIGDLTYLLDPHNVVRVEHFTNLNYKMPFGYYRFYLKNGDQFLLTENTKAFFRIFEYFKHIPITTHKRFFPLIR